MKIEEFVKIEGMKDLVDATGGGSNSNYTQNKIFDMVKEGLAGNQKPNAIKQDVANFLEKLVLDTDELGNKTTELMKSWGFKFDE